MGKTIFIVRHAKSCWEDVSSTDKDRPLNTRGKKNAPDMAAHLLKNEGIPDLLVSSPAKRALSTAKIFAKQFQIDSDQILIVDRIYEAFPDDLMKVILQLPDDKHKVYLFGHNPGITYLVNRFDGGEDISNVPTTGIIRMDTTADSWSQFSPSNSRIVAYYAPKISL